MKTIKDLIRIAEDEGWNISRYEEESTIDYEIGMYSDAGQDFYVPLTIRKGEKEAEDLVNEFFEYAYAFDPIEEAMKWVGDDGHGANGAPDDPRDIIEDMESCKTAMKELLAAWA